VTDSKTKGVVGNKGNINPIAPNPRNTYPSAMSNIVFSCISSPPIALRSSSFIHILQLFMFTVIISFTSTSYNLDFQNFYICICNLGLYKYSRHFFPFLIFIILGNRVYYIILTSLLNYHIMWYMSSYNSTFFQKFFSYDIFIHMSSKHIFCITL
jgi:hypothetical protein